MKVKVKDAAELNTALAFQLRMLRERAGMSQDELAGRLGVHRNTVYNWERGAGLGTVLFLRICTALDADAGAVLEKVLHTKN